MGDSHPEAGLLSVSVSERNTRRVKKRAWYRNRRREWQILALCILILLCLFTCALHPEGLRTGGYVFPDYSGQIEAIPPGGDQGRGSSSASSQQQTISVTNYYGAFFAFFSGRNDERGAFPIDVFPSGAGPKTPIAPEDEVAGGTTEAKGPSGGNGGNGAPGFYIGPSGFRGVGGGPIQLNTPSPGIAAPVGAGAPNGTAGPPNAERPDHGASAEPAGDDGANQPAPGNVGGPDTPGDQDSRGGPTGASDGSDSGDPDVPDGPDNPGDQGPAGPNADPPSWPIFPDPTFDPGPGPGDGNDPDIIAEGPPGPSQEEEIVAVPEPSTALLLLGGLLGFITVLRYDDAKRRGPIPIRIQNRTSGSVSE